MSWLSRRGKASGPASDGTRPQPAPRPPAAPPEPRARVAPLSQQRLRAALDRHDWHYRIDDEGDITGRWDDDIITFLLRGDNGEVLNVLGYMHEDLPMGRLDEVRYALEEWHRGHLWPTCFWRDNEDAGLTFSVGGAVAVDYEHGVTDDQLDLHLSCAISTIGSAMADVRNRLGMSNPASDSGN